MTASVIIHPASRLRGLENARFILRSRPGLFTDGETLEACALLIDCGTWNDAIEGRAVRDVITSRAVAELNRREQDRRDALRRPSGWLVPTFVLGVAIWAIIIGYAIGAMGLP